MRRLGAVWLAVGLLAVQAAGDRVVLKDGRVFEGKVTEAEGKVLIEMAYGTISFPRPEVESIQRMPTPAELLEWQLSRIDRTDPDALFQAAAWAKDNDLPKQADELLKEVLGLNPDHVQARKLLGYLRADGKWLKVSEALQLARGKLEAGKYAPLLKELLPAIEEMAHDAKVRLEVAHLEAHGQLRSKQFARARVSFEELARRAPPAQSLRYRVIGEVLAKHPDGMYVVSASYPRTAMVLGADVPTLEPGPASLSRPEVLAAALHDYAARTVKQGQALMAEAKPLERTEPEAAKARYARAGKCFDIADAIVPNIARSYRVEIVRRQVAIINNDIDGEAEKFDLLKGELGKKNLSPAAYRDLLSRMLRALNHIRADLDAILKLTAPFERELILEITDANGELQKINALRQVVLGELNELR